MKAFRTFQKGQLNLSISTSVPVVLQSEVAECGLACVAMIASYFGYRIDIASLRRKFSTSLKGINLNHLLYVADGCGLSARAVRCELEELRQLRVPAILHWDLNHFVVLVRSRGDDVWIHDPAVGKRKLKMKECSRRFTGVALELQPGVSFRPAKKIEQMSVRQLWSRLDGLYRALATLFAMSILLQFAAIGAPYYMQWVVDHVLVTADRDLLVVLAFGFMLLMLTTTFLGALRSWLVLRLASMLNLQMGVNLLRHLLRLPLDFFEKRHLGDLMSRFASLGQVRERMTTGVVETVVDGIMSVMVLVVMLLYSVSLTLVVLAAVSLYLCIRLVCYGPLYRASEEAILAGASEQSNFLENLRGIQTIKLFAAEGLRLGLWQNRFTDLINTEIYLGKLGIGFSVVSGLIFGAENILIVYLAALLVLQGDMSIGMVLAFMAYKGQLTSRLSNLVEQLIAFRMLRLHLNRLADIALSKPESQDGSFSFSLSSTQPGNYEVDGLAYRYGDNEEFIFHDASFSVLTGEAVAIVGPSGGGKTTLIKLLAGLLSPTRGLIRFDSIDIKQLGLSEYRRQLAAVMQNDTLLSGSVLENLSFFASEPDFVRVQNCARMAAIGNEIESLPMGYHSMVGDMGNQFSGGQIQRLLLARALYQQPRVLLLDEATSQLDEANEYRIAEQLRDLPMTRIIVAHRPETIREADKILLVENGKVTDITHTNSAEVDATLSTLDRAHRE